MRPLLLALGALAACAPEGVPMERLTLHGELQEPVPNRAGDPLRVNFSVQRTFDGVPTDLCSEPRSAWCNVRLRDVQPIVVGPDGFPMATVELTSASGEHSDWAVPEGPPGQYRVVGAADFAMPLVGELSFHVDDWGAATDFDDGEVVGLAFELLDYSTRPFDVSGLLEQPPVYAQIDSTDGVQAEFRMLTELEGTTCTVLAAVGVWEGSELVYASERLSVEHPDLGELVAQDVRLALGFRSDDLDLVDARLDFRTDTRSFDPLLDGDAPGSGDISSFVEALGSTPDACDDGELECVALHAYAGRFAALDTPFADELPFCGIDAVGTPTLPSFSCDYEPVSCDVGCSSAGRSFGPLGLFFVPWMLRRRRG